jgi:hypothetical protein
MSKNIFYVLIAALTFQSASACFYSRSLEIKNRIEEAIACNSLQFVECQFKCLEKEGVVFTPEMLEAYCQFSFERIAQLEARKAEATNPYELKNIYNYASSAAFFSGIAGVSLSVMMVKWAQSVSSGISFCECLDAREMAIYAGLAAFLSIMVVNDDLDKADAKLKAPLGIQNRLDEQTRIYEFLQQKLFNANCVCQVA